MPFEVIGDQYDEEIEGDVMGDVMGYEGPEGYEVEGHGHPHYRRVGAVWGPPEQHYYPVVGAGPARPGGALVRVHRPPWRSRQLAPGVIAPDQGLLPLAMHGDTGTDTFTATQTTITFQGQIQKPFRGERLLVDTVRTGASATGKLQGLLFIGTDLQQLDIKPFSLEQVGATTGFGVRLTMKPAQPGVFIRIVATLAPSNPTGNDTIFCDITMLGRNVH